MNPPTTAPPILLTRTWTADPDEQIGAGVEIVDGRLRLHGRGPGVVTGQGITTEPVRDVVIDTVVRAQRHVAGRGLRRVLPPEHHRSLHLVAGLDRAACSAISAMDGTESVLAAGTARRRDGPAHRARRTPTGSPSSPSGRRSRSILNGLVVTSVIVDPRYAEGHAGVMVEQRDPASEPRLDVEWFQVRAVLPD